MNYIFTNYNNTPLLNFSLRTVEKMPASGATLLFSSLVLCQRQNLVLGGAKATGLHDRKTSCIELIQRGLRSCNRESFRTSPKLNFDVDRALVEKPQPPKLASSFVSSLLEFIGILRLKYIPYTTCEEITPWSMPRHLQVYQLPQPVFQSHPPHRTFYPQVTEKETFNRYPLIPDMKEEEPEALENQAVITTLEMKGILRQKETGLVYLDISTNFAEMIVPIIHKIEPTPTFVPVILAHEAQSKAGLGPIKELGEVFSFQLSDLYVVKPLLWPQIEKVYFFIVDAPELNDLRRKYLLPGTRPLHMTLGIKREDIPSRPRQELYRLNVCCSAA